MKTRYRIVDANGDECDKMLFRPWTDIPVTMQTVTFWPAIDPEGEDEMVVTLRYEHDKSNEELGL